MIWGYSDFKVNPVWKPTCVFVYSVGCAIGCATDRGVTKSNFPLTVNGWISIIALAEL